MEDPTKCEDVEVSNANACPQINQACPDAKSLTDNKNTQIRVVRGAKKLKTDNNDPISDKKGACLCKSYGDTVSLHVSLHYDMLFEYFFKI